MKSIALPQRTLPRFLSTSLELQRAAMESALRKRIRAARQALFAAEQALLALPLVPHVPSSAHTTTLAGIQATLRPMMLVPGVHYDVR